MKTSSESIPIDIVDPNPYQPREKFSEKSLAELRESIQQNGLIQPIVVRKVGERFQLLAGERRLRAVKDLGLPAIAALIRDLNDEEMRTLSIIENLHRDDLTPIELARSYRDLMEQTQGTQDEVAKRLGKDRSTIANILRLLELPGEIQTDVDKGKISAGHARALLPLKDEERIYIIRDEIIKKNLSVREVEKLVRNAGRKSKPKGKKSGQDQIVKDPNTRELEERLSLRLNTQVEIWGTSEGSIQVYFSSVEEFNRIFNEILEGDDEE